MRDLPTARRLARHRGRAGPTAKVAGERAWSRVVTLAALALVVATVLTYWQMQMQVQVQETGTEVADGTSVAVAVPESSGPPATASPAPAPAAPPATESSAPPATASPALDAAPPAGPRVVSARWRRVLEQLNDKRHAAWAQGDPRMLREVYVPRSRPLELDREALLGYLSRGLRVQGVRLQFAQVQVLATSPGLVSLRVVDRLDEMTARASDGRVLSLPLDQPTRHRIVLRSLDGSWRIAAVSTR